MGNNIMDYNDYIDDADYMDIGERVARTLGINTPTASNNEITRQRAINARPKASLGDILNQFSQGKQIDYNTAMSLYPQTQTQSPDTYSKLFFKSLAGGNPDPTVQESFGAKVARGLNTADDQRRSQLQAIMDAHNKDRVGQFTTGFNLADKGYGNLMEQKKLDEMVRQNNMQNAIHRGNLDVSRQQLNMGKYVPFGNDDQGNAILLDQKTGELIDAGKINMFGNKGGKTGSGSTMGKPLPTGQLNVIDKELGKMFGIYGDDNKPTNKIDFDKQQFNILKSYAAHLLQTGQASDAATAAKQTFDMLSNNGEPGYKTDTNWFSKDKLNIDPATINRLKLSPDSLTLNQMMGSGQGVQQNDDPFERNKR